MKMRGLESKLECRKGGKSLNDFSVFGNVDVLVKNLGSFKKLWSKLLNILKISRRWGVAILA